MKAWARVGIEMDINIDDIQNEQKVIKAIRNGRINGEVYFPQEVSENDALYETLRLQGNNRELSLDVLEKESLPNKGGSKYIESVTTDKVELQIYECSCGFHLGIDATYLDQVDDCSIVCPSCGELFTTEAEDDGEDAMFDDEHSPCKKLNFSTVSEGLEKIKEEYLNGEVTEGEFADCLVLHFDEYFDASINPTIAMRAIQEFRQWDYQMEGDDAIETFGGTEALSENGYYGFIFMRNGQSMQLPDGVRIGIKQEDGGIALDEGITACFSRSL